MLPFYAYLLLLLPICLTNGCQFEGLLASCPMTLGGHHVHVSARINHCHNPIDVYFLVEANNDRTTSANNTDTQSLRHRPLYWHYTYVTTNHPESREMPGYGQRVLLHVVAETRLERGGRARRLKLKAQFLIDGATDDTLTFIEDEVRIPHFEDCQYANREEDQIGNIALGCIVTVIVLCVLGLVGLWYFRPKKADEDEVDLVNNMERPHMSPRPAEDLNVHYVVPRPESNRECSSEELSVYISTSNGLQKLERKASQNSIGSGSSCSTSTHQSGSSARSNNAVHVSVPVSNNEEDLPPHRSSSKMSSSSNDSNSIDRSRGAIPKRRLPPPLSAPSSPSSSSDSSSPSR